MKKNILLPAIIVLVIISCTIFISDGATYLVTSLMALIIIGVIRSNRSWVMKMTRWGKANPHKAQVFIAVLQIVLMIFGLVAGYNFKRLGYEFSDTSAFVFGTIMVAGFLSVPFLPKRSIIAIPAEVDKNRLIFMGITLSSFVLTVMTGNRIEDMYPNSPITRSLQVIDQAIFPDNSIQFADQNVLASEIFSNEDQQQAITNSSSSLAVFASFEKETIEPNPISKKEVREKLKTEKKEKKLEKKKARKMKRLERLRMAFAAGISAGAVILIVLLVLTFCAGVCLFIAGFSGSAALIPLGAVIAGGSVWGIIKLSKGNKGNNKP